MMRKEVENDESIKSKVQKQAIRQNPEVTLCCDVRCKIVGRSEEPNVYISNEQTTAAATLSFLQTSISWKHNFCLPVLVPSRDPKSCESRNPMCSKPTPAFKKSQSVMDDDLLLMVRSGFAVAAVPVLVPNPNSCSLTLLHNKCIQIEERGKQGERGKRRETALAGASPPSPSLSSVKGGEERACIQERRDAVCRHRRRPGACRRAASRRRPVHGPTSLRYCRSVHKPSSMGHNREERETHEEKLTTSLVAVSAAGCRHHPRELPPHRRYRAAAPPLLHSAAAASRQAAAGGGWPANFVSAYGFLNLRKRQCRCCLLGSRPLLPLESRTGKERRPFSVVIGAAIGRLKPLLIMILLSGYFLVEIEGTEQKSDSETKKDCRCCWILTSLHSKWIFWSYRSPIGALSTALESRHPKLSSNI
ncbi:uncharacterized protein LOC107478066 isoform X2 [Arachis duranensis]|uniref:Uncharacterized protein LOC107478066 isoform X2 n=1 Tax=Arachis duranensis TaxID=130453 RepID=A0A6P5N830_ARADU|nr:uncharacterized protein LOC107478066 isoform X2 [Arachis duranensis]